MKIDLFLLIHLLLCHCCLSVRDVRLVLPTAVMTGQSVRLICLFDLQGAPLYSVKWYRGQREFYRYVPKEEPPSKHFPFPGITIDMSQSDANQVRLTEMHPDLTGNFSCEVTADAPSFRTAIASQAITIVEMPDRAPIITVRKKVSDTGQQIISANCTAFHSRPPGNISLYLNEVPVSDRKMRRFKAPDKAALDVVGVTTVLSTEQLNDMTFSLRLRCTASVFTFSRMTEVLLIEQRLRSEAASAAMEANSTPKLKGIERLILALVAAQIWR